MGVSRLLALVVVVGILIAAAVAMRDMNKGTSTTGNPIAPVVVTAQMPNPLAGQ